MTENIAQSSRRYDENALHSRGIRAILGQLGNVFSFSFGVLRSWGA
jgi:hypothetical protein